jgi:hypothetical protein
MRIFLIQKFSTFTTTGWYTNHIVQSSYNITMDGTAVLSHRAIRHTRLVTNGKRGIRNCNGWLNLCSL